jgi:predicted XRE-type DNA-binding protein
MKSTPSVKRATAVNTSSGNAYADLDCAENDGMLVKAQIVAKIAEIIEQRQLTQNQAAKMLRLTQPKISRLLRGQFRGISEGRLLRCLTRLGRDVQIKVTLTPRRPAKGRLTVRFG